MVHADTDTVAFKHILLSKKKSTQFRELLSFSSDEFVEKLKTIRGLYVPNINRPSFS